MSRKAIDLIGEKFGRLTVIGKTGKRDSSGCVMWKVRCSCDKKSVKLVSTANLKSKGIKSCGCYTLERVTKHGLRYNPLYNILYNMYDRCYNKRAVYYDRYGGRGIKVCSEWRIKKDYQGLKNFIAWNESLPKKEQWRKGLEIDRKNNNKGYYPWNCRWTEEINNKSNRERTVFVEYKGEKIAFRLLFEKYDTGTVSYNTAFKRLSYGWDPIDCIKTPVKVR